MNRPVIRRATRDDIPEIIAMLADDPLGATRESLNDLTPYLDAFETIDADPRQTLAVCEMEGAIVGTLQITFIPGLSRKGAMRALVEAVRIHRDARGHGLGATMLTWAVNQARTQGCGMVQLTMDASRADAHRFYEKLGFEPTHVGFKMVL